MTRIAVLIGSQRRVRDPHGGFGLLADLPDLLGEDDVVPLYADDDPKTAASAEVGIGGPNAERVSALLDAAPKLRWYHTMSAGVERLLAIVLKHERVTLTNNSGAYDLAIAEHVIASVFAIAKHQPLSFAAQRRREWHADPRNTDVRGATIAILGMGSIGGEVARIARGLGMRVIGIRRTAVEDAVGPERLADAAAEADYLAVCAPLTDATKGLVDDAVIRRMKPAAWIVNISRGAIVDEQALLAALREKRIGGAAIDAWWQEPLPPDSPWWELPNVIVTPHTSYSSPSVRDRSIGLLTENLRRFKAGEPLLNVVDVARGY